MATFNRHTDVEWTGSVMDGKGEMKAGIRRVHAAGDVSVALWRRGRQDQRPGVS